LFWDLLGKQTGRSLQSLIGGEKEQIEIGTNHSIVSNLQGLLNEIGAVQAEGIRRIKVKIQPGWITNRCKRYAGGTPASRFWPTPTARMICRAARSCSDSTNLKWRCSNSR